MLLADDIARELGYEYEEEKISDKCVRKYSSIKWQRINEYLAEYGFPPTGSKR